MVWVCWPPRWPPDLVKYSHGPRCWRQPRGQRPIVQGWPFRLRRARHRLAERFPGEVADASAPTRISGGLRLLGLRAALRRGWPAGAVGGAPGGTDRCDVVTFPAVGAGEPVAGLGRRTGLPGTGGAWSLCRLGSWGSAPGLGERAARSAADLPCEPCSTR
jgi:hypothetical protein